MKQWLKESFQNLLGLPTGRSRYLLCACGHVTLSKLPNNSRCEFVDGKGVQGCDAITKPLTRPLWGIFPLSERVIQLQTRVYTSQISSLQLSEAYQSYCRLNEDSQAMVAFFQGYFPGDMTENSSRSITAVAIARMKKMLAEKGVPVVA
jgi:hypothetical protein